MGSALRSGYFPTWVFTFALFPMGLGALIPSTLDVLAARRLARLPVVKGIVLSSKRSPRLLGPAQPDIRYSYEVGGRPYVSDRVWAGNTINIVPLLTTAATEKIVAQFPLGKVIPVYVDPVAPAQPALIASGARAERWLAVLMFFLIAGLLAPFAAKRENIGTEEAL